MQEQPCHANILLAQNAYCPQARSGELRCQRVHNVIHVFQVSLNPPRDVRIVGDRFCSYCVVRGFGLYDVNSPDAFRRALITRRTIVIKLVLIGFIARTNQNTDANLPTIVTNLCQRGVEVMLVLPLNVCPFWYLTSHVMSNLDVGSCVHDAWKIAAADDHDGRDYRYYNQREQSR